jgi:hypothetical protein
MEKGGVKLWYPSEDNDSKTTTREINKKASSDTELLQGGFFYDAKYCSYKIQLHLTILVSKSFMIN